MTWKWFSAKQLHDAVKHTESGGISIYESPIRGKEKASLMGPDVTKLTTAAQELGLQSRWLQKGHRPHFILKGEPLREAKRKCKQPEVSTV